MNNFRLFFASFAFFFTLFALLCVGAGSVTLTNLSPLLSLAGFCPRYKP